MVVFGDVISSQSDTVDSLQDAFTVPQHSDLSILQLAGAAGFRTTWLSNQNQFGLWDSPVRIMAQQADQVRYHDPSLGNLASRRVFDAAMLPSLDQVLAQAGNRKLIFMHLMSTHLPYCWTKPPGFNPLHERLGTRFYGQRGGLRSRLKLFLTRQGGDVDCYDNGVRYVDAVLGAVIRRAERLGGPAAVVYFSDHGEAPLLGTGHDGAEHSAMQIEVPLLLWANDSYRSAHPATWAAAEANRAKPFSLALLTPTLASLLELRTPLVSPQDSLFEHAFRPRPRYALDGRIHYDARWPGNDYRENSRNFVLQLGPARDLVWAHRTDSLGALLEAKRTFAGVEMDVVFDERTGRFRVHHPPVPDIGIDLEDMLAWSSDKPRLKLWLDWKNATPGNVDAALAELARLDAHYHIKGRSLVETDSGAVSPALAAISGSGFLHGYYMPVDEMGAAMKQGKGAVDALARRIETVVVQGRFDAVTYDAAAEPFVASALDAFLTQHRIRRFSWDTTINSGRPDTDPAAVAKAIRQRHLSGLLVHFPSYFLI
jgi:heptose-I-phosphate ethanolaminephosphotransferase